VYLLPILRLQKSCNFPLFALMFLRFKKAISYHLIHNLTRLTEIAGIRNDLNAEQVAFLAELTPYSIEARYGDYKESLSEIINEQRAKEVYEKTEEIFQWLYRKIN